MFNQYPPQYNGNNAAMAQRARMPQPMSQAQRGFQASCVDANTLNPQYITVEAPSSNLLPIQPDLPTPEPLPDLPVPDPGPGSRPDSDQCTSPLPESLVCYEYIPGFLRAHIGDLVRVEFLMYDAMTDRVGILSEVGSNYIVLQSLDGANSLMCDLFSIKFVTIMQKNYVDYVAVRATESSRLSFKG